MPLISGYETKNIIDRSNVFLMFLFFLKKDFAETKKKSKEIQDGMSPLRVPIKTDSLRMAFGRENTFFFLLIEGLGEFLTACAKN
jgi:hypothetical protein